MHIILGKLSAKRRETLWLFNFAIKVISHHILRSKVFHYQDEYSDHQFRPINVVCLSKYEVLCEGNNWIQWLITLPWWSTAHLDSIEMWHYENTILNTYWYSRVVMKWYSVVNASQMDNPSGWVSIGAVEHSIIPDELLHMNWNVKHILQPGPNEWLSSIWTGLIENAQHFLILATKGRELWLFIHVGWKTKMQRESLEHIYKNDIWYSSTVLNMFIKEVFHIYHVWQCV